ncbi:MAG: 2-oxo-4-hydroxy-4-carboxy-5-ureidoimidazoline decarboxylase [Actinobacteria bacterium]|nr:2-oxo-4-hydroxy-4-carboxy-5-ureidoimidazoline decarboxylase [Actinomycetota bacterium]
MRELPRQLSADELAELFGGRTRVVQRLEGHEDPLGAARDVLGEAPEEEQIEALNAHPPIGARRLAGHSALEQGTDDDPALRTTLAYLNEVYEEKFGFRFLVFVNRRPKAEIVTVLEERLARTREKELETALDELVAIARDRWESGATA